MKILVIVPAYNESAAIAGTIKEIQEKAPEADILVINDGSSDDTAGVVSRCGVKYLSHCINLGIGAAVQSGFLYARDNGYTYAVQIDGDGQHDPAYILPMIAWMEKENIDVGIGSRFISHQGFQSSRMRRLGIWFLSHLVRLSCGLHIRDVTSGYRVSNRRYIEIFARNYSDDYPESDAIPVIAFTGGKAAEYPMIMRERRAGHSSIDLGHSFYYIVKASLSIILSRFVYPVKKTT